MTATSCSDQLKQRPLVTGRQPESNSVPSQLLFREVNEQISLRLDSFGRADAEIEVVCECERPSCSKGLRFSLEQYEAIRLFPTRFVMNHGHSTAEDERVVEEHDGFVVVEKTGSSAQIAIRLDPRRHRRLSSQAV